MDKLVKMLTSSSASLKSSNSQVNESIIGWLFLFQCWWQFQNGCLHDQQCILIFCFQIAHQNPYQGIPQQLGTKQIAGLIAFSPGHFVFKNKNVKVKVKYGFVLHTGSPLQL